MQDQPAFTPFCLIMNTQPSFGFTVYVNIYIFLFIFNLLCNDVNI